MSKKRKKFKKKFKAEIIAGLKKTEQPITETVIEPENPKISESDVKKETTEAKTETKLALNDLKKIALVFSGLFILLLIIYFISLKTTWLTQFSDLLAKWANIQ